mgnify:FL=1|tara:strand:+ start:147 stop:362 length:216 start_codon:yes stop_codon:yes gene_type:complete
MIKPKMSPNTSLIDRVVQLLNLGFKSHEVFKDIIDYYPNFYTKKSQQELIDFIEQTNQCNVFAVGVIPTIK